MAIWEVILLLRSATKEMPRTSPNILIGPKRRFELPVTTHTPKQIGTLVYSNNWPHFLRGSHHLSGPKQSFFQLTWIQKQQKKGQTGNSLPSF